MKENIMCKNEIINKDRFTDTVVNVENKDISIHTPSVLTATLNCCFSMPEKTVRVTLPKEVKAVVKNCFTGMDEYLTVDYPF